MARLNVEDCWWSDPRRQKLSRLMGGDLRGADGLAMQAWRLAQEFWKSGRLVPVHQFEALDGFQLLTEAGLAEVREEGVYVRGSSTYLDWLREKKVASQIGGKKSAQRPRDEKGRLKAAKTSKQSPSTLQAEPKLIQPSYSSSSSFSSSKEKEENKEASPAGRKLRSLPLLAEIWNRESGTLPKVVCCSTTRTKGATSRWSEHPEESFWVDVIRRIAASPFCRGENDRRWRADFDFLIKPDTAARVLEGKYSDRTQPPPPRIEMEWKLENA